MCAFVCLLEIVLGLLEIETITLIAMHEYSEGCYSRFCLQLDFVMSLNKEKGNASELPVPHFSCSSVRSQGRTSSRFFEVSKITHVPHKELLLARLSLCKAVLNVL